MQNRAHSNHKISNSFEVKLLPALIKGHPSLQSKLIDAKLRAFSIYHMHPFLDIYFTFSASQVSSSAQYLLCILQHRLYTGM